MEAWKGVKGSYPRVLNRFFHKQKGVVNKLAVNLFTTQKYKGLRDKVPNAQGTSFANYVACAGTENTIRLPGFQWMPG